VAFGDEFKDICGGTATREPFASQDAYGQITYDSSEDLANVRLVRKHQVVRTREGDEEVSSAQLWIVESPFPSVDERDRFTLSDGSQPPILSIERHEDEAGNVSHVKVSFR